jgi:hypothetical protein
MALGAAGELYAATPWIPILRTAQYWVLGAIAFGYAWPDAALWPFTVLVSLFRRRG